MKKKNRNKKSSIHDKGVIVAIILLVACFGFLIYDDMTRPKPKCLNMGPDFAIYGCMTSMPHIIVELK